MIRTILILFLFSLPFFGHGQTSFSLIGQYKTSVIAQKIDTIKLYTREDNPMHVEPIYFMPFKSSQKLIIRRFGRFKIIDELSVTTDIGLNTDYPTYTGRYITKGNAVTIKIKKAVQHFNKAAPKRRVKTKLNDIKRYTLEKNKQLLSEDQRYVWSKQ